MPTTTDLFQLKSELVITWFRITSSIRSP